MVFRVLLHLCRASGLHPRCFDITGLTKVGPPRESGRLGDSWKGLIGTQSIRVKVLRLFKKADIESLLKEFGREALTWRRLCHPNVLPFLGIYHLDGNMCLVAPWMENGNIMEFLKNEPSTTVRLSFILDIAFGLDYLHGQKLVHGDLKAINILVTPSRRACIANFGLAQIVNSMALRSAHSTANVQGGPAGYLAPELLEGHPSHLGVDVYAFASTCYEILTGRAPFHELSTEMAIKTAVIKGIRPSRPEAFSANASFDGLWELLKVSWDGHAKKRPTAGQIVQRLEGLAIPEHSMTDWDETFTPKMRRSLQDAPLLPWVAQIEHLLFGDGEFSFVSA
ncbi:kinase-like domain-containing protein [Mycena galopus ATCC 62051]|nr:kinase-like domain-containing protein [Mycena galopus ATCC 62051]